MALRSLISIVLMAGATAPVVAQQQGPLPSVTLPDELAVVLRSYEAAWTARAPDRLAALFAEDGFVLQPGKAPVRGRDGITEAYRGHGGPLALRALAFAVSDTIAHIVGAYARSTEAPDVGKFILLLRRRSPGEPWRIFADMDNGN